MIQGNEQSPVTPHHAETWPRHRLLRFIPVLFLNPVYDMCLYSKHILTLAEGIACSVLNCRGKGYAEGRASDTLSHLSGSEI